MHKLIVDYGCMKIMNLSVHIWQNSVVQVGTLLPNRAYAFFSHTHKAQQENMPLLDEVQSQPLTLFMYILVKVICVLYMHLGTVVM